MTAEQKAAYIQSQTACAMLEALGMLADTFSGAREVQPYTKNDFMELMNKYGIHHNTVMDFMRD